MMNVVSEKRDYVVTCQIDSLSEDEANALYGEIRSIMDAYCGKDGGAQGSVSIFEE